jgi:hypothetical protein
MLLTELVSPELPTIIGLFNSIPIYFVEISVMIHTSQRGHQLFTEEIRAAN